MCLLICAPKGQVEDVSALEMGYTNNGDGAGFAYAYDKQLIVQKGFFTFEEFYSEYEKIPKDAPNIVHFRAATHGNVDEENCHPFNINNKLVFAHNGVISCTPGNKEYSDTYQFNEIILKPLFAKNPNAVFTSGGKIVLEETIGPGNKLAFLNHLGETTIINERAGDWHGDVWFSNMSWYMEFSRRYRWESRGSQQQQFPALADKPKDNIITIPSLNKENPVWLEFLKDCYIEHIQSNSSEPVGAS